jgi:hypothetical protein
MENTNNPVDTKRKIYEIPVRPIPTMDVQKRDCDCINPRPMPAYAIFPCLSPKVYNSLGNAEQFIDMILKRNCMI